MITSFVFDIKKEHWLQIYTDEQTLHDQSQMKRAMYMKVWVISHMMIYTEQLIDSKLLRPDDWEASSLNGKILKVPLICNDERHVIGSCCRFVLEEGLGS